MLGVLIFAADVVLASKAATRTADENDVQAEKSPQEANAVRLVVGVHRMTFEGSNVTWETLPMVLEKVQGREKTVLELAVDNKKIPLSVYEDAQKRSEKLVKKFGFANLKYIGVYPIGSKAGELPAEQPKRRERPKQEVKISPVGKWETVDFVPAIEVFEPGKKSGTGEFHLKNLTFLADGRTSGVWLWKKDYIWSPNEKSKTKGKLVVKEIDGDTYLFMEWISGDVIKKHQKPFYYVLKKVGDIKKP